MSNNVMFVCERCGFDTKYKSNLVCHLNCKTPCTVSGTNISREELIEKLTKKEMKEHSVKCEDCNKIVHKSGIARHKKCCKGKHNDAKDKEKDKTLEQLQQEVAELKQIVKDMQASSSKTTVNTNSNNTTNNTNNTTNNIQNINIIVNTFGQEQLGHLTPEFLSNCIANPTKGFSKLIENIHYNPDVPENHNLRFKSSKRNTFERYDNEDWHECDASNTLEELIRKGYRILNAHYAEHFLTNPEIQDNEITRRAYERFRFLSDKQTQEYCAVKRDLRVLVKDRTAFILVAPDVDGEVAT